MDLDLLPAFHCGDIPLLCCDLAGRLSAASPPPRALLCGSFNPLHDGHRQLAAVAARRLAVPVDFEIGVVNADKAPLSAEELRRRLGQFVGVGSVWLTPMPTFAAKAGLFPGVWFVVGADTAQRIVAPRFYNGSSDEMLEGLARVRAAGVRFLVAGRADHFGRFVAAEGLDLPNSVRDLFEFIPEHQFRMDLASTQLRNRGPVP